MWEKELATCRYGPGRTPSAPVQLLEQMFDQAEMQATSGQRHLRKAVALALGQTSEILLPELSPLA
jgi:hypothetical protein